MDLIQNELISKAFTLGFKSYFGLMTSVNKECYNLWMADLPKWLREVHNIYLTVIPVGDSGYELRYWYYSILGVDCKDGQHGINRFQTYEEALEAGLLKALKLVK